jgi:hypothetical protein
MNTDTLSPSAILISGAEIVADALVPYGFNFRYGGSGRGSGGHFAWGEFVLNDRRLEFHYRRGLGLVTYHLGNHRASHEAYMRELGVLDKNRYPGFSSQHLQSFRDLAHDLSFASDFVSGDASVLVAAAVKDAETIDRHSKELMSGYVGDTAQLEKMRDLFHQGRYVDVLAGFAKLKYPDRLTNAQQEMVRIAHERTSHP